MIRKKTSHVMKNSPPITYFQPSIIAEDSDVKYTLYRGMTTDYNTQSTNHVGKEEFSEYNFALASYTSEAPSIIKKRRAYL